MAEPADDRDLVEVEPVTVIGRRMGELVDLPDVVHQINSVQRRVGSRGWPTRT